MWPTSVAKAAAILRRAMAGVHPAASQRGSNTRWGAGLGSLPPTDRNAPMAGCADGVHPARPAAAGPGGRGPALARDAVAEWVGARARRPERPRPVPAGPRAGTEGRAWFLGPGRPASILGKRRTGPPRAQASSSGHRPSGEAASAREQRRLRLGLRKGTKSMRSRCQQRRHLRSHGCPHPLPIAFNLLPRWFWVPGTVCDSPPGAAAACRRSNTRRLNSLCLGTSFRLSVSSAHTAPAGC